MFPYTAFITRYSRIYGETYLVPGATGTVGRDVVKLLSKKGAAVRAGVRDQAKARQRFDDDIALVTFDFQNESSFAAALDGAEKVFLLPPLLPNQVLTNAFVDAAKHAGVRRI